MKDTDRRICWAAAVVIIAGFGTTLRAQDDWRAGDVFLGTGGGHIEVFRPSSNANPVETLSDGISGPVTSSFVDNTWHLLVTDPGSQSNQANIARFSILPGTTQQGESPQSVLSTFSAGSCSGIGSANVRALAVNAQGDIFVANSTPPTIVELGPTGNCIAALALPSTIKSIVSIDLSTDGNTLWFTSGSNSVGKIALPLTSSSAVSTLSTSTNLPRTTKLFDLRVVPAGSLGSLPGSCNGVACPAVDDSLLVVAQGSNSFCNGQGSCVVLMDAVTGAVVTKYTVAGQNSLQSLTLDPIVRGCVDCSAVLNAFWVAPSSSSFFQVNVASGSSTAFSAGNGVVISSLFVYGGFGANEPIPTQFSGKLTTAANVAVFNFESNTLNISQYPPPISETDLSVFATTIPPGVGSNDANQPCTPTSGSDCVLWEIESSPVDASLSFQLSGPNSSILGDNNTRVFRDEATDITVSLDITGFAKNSLYSLNQIAGNNEGCAYMPPTQFQTNNTTPYSINANRNSITFRFQCTGLPGSQLARLAPRISVVEVSGGQVSAGQAPGPFFPGVSTLVGGTCCTVADYRYDSSSNTWVLNVSFKGVSAGSEFDATTFDDNHIATAFHTLFTVGTSTQ